MQYVPRVVGDGGIWLSRSSGGHEGESLKSEWGSPCSGRESDVRAAGSSARYSFVIIVIYHWTESNKHGDKHFFRRLGWCFDYYYWLLKCVSCIIILFRLSLLSHCKSGTEQERCYCNQCYEKIGCTFSLFVYAWRTCRVCKRKIFHYCCITLVRKIIGMWIYILRSFFT